MKLNSIQWHWRFPISVLSRNDVCCFCYLDRWCCGRTCWLPISMRFGDVVYRYVRIIATYYATSSSLGGTDSQVGDTSRTSEWIVSSYLTHRAVVDNRFSQPNQLSYNVGINNMGNMGYEFRKHVLMALYRWMAIRWKHYRGRRRYLVRISEGNRVSSDFVVAYVNEVGQK